MFKRLLVCCFSLVFSAVSFAQNKTLRVGIAGLSHDHVRGLLGRKDLSGIAIVGIAEADQKLAEHYSKEYGFPMSLVYNSVQEMLDAVKPEAVMAFGPIDQHLDVVEKCAPRGIHVMVEKPLAVNLEQAKKMKSLATQYHIQVMTNYETTWYPSNAKVHNYLKNDSLGSLLKVVVHDGHKGPKNIGVSPEFLEWLTDSVHNGGGAIMDFGCYGANLVTWMMDGKKPEAVMAMTQQLQRANNPQVDDESCIILKYKSSNAIIEGSWNWPVGRKDMEVYGLKGEIFADNKYNLRVHTLSNNGGFKECNYQLQDLEPPFNDPFEYFASLIRKQIKQQPFEPSSLENNLVVMEILDAAKKSAQSNRTVFLDQ